MVQVIDSITLASVYLRGFRRYSDGGEVGDSKGSGFLWRKEDQDFIITNWHNVTGLDPIKDEPLGTFAPSHFRLAFKYFVEGKLEPGKRVIRQSTREMPLYDDDDAPLWIEHERGRGVDVVAIPISFELPEDGQLSYMNEQDFESRWSPEIGADCYIVGYPEGISSAFGTPIWKRASIASMPQLNHDDQPVLLVDTIGNHGLSGSPVVAKASGIFMPGEDANPAKDDVIGTWMNFVGVYAGRLSEEGIGSQLGRVWKGKTIDEILSRI